MKKPTKSPVTKDSLLGSSPIGHPKKSRESVVNKEKLEKPVRKKMAHLAHFGSDDIAPGGGIIQDQMQHLITTCTTGPRWYVSYYVESPSGRIRKRAYGRVNAEKDLIKRKKLLFDLQVEIFNSLTSVGHVPEKNTFLSPKTIYKEADRMIESKSHYLKKNSVKTIIHYIGVFKEWLLISNLASRHPGDIKSTDLLSYRDWLIKKRICNRTINNYMREARSLFAFTIDSEDQLVYKNPLEKIKRLPSHSEVHIAYSQDQFQNMIDYMKDRDHELLFFIKLIAFAYFRIDEARNIKIADIRMDSKKIMLSAVNNKTNKRTFKIIQEIILDEFIKRKLDQYPEHYFLFGRNKKPGPIQVGENYFRKHFKKVKKKFSLGKQYTIYGFRHTTVTQLLEGGEPWHEVMNLTGHENMESFQQYARCLLGKDALDHSNVYTIKL